MNYHDTLEYSLTAQKRLKDLVPEHDHYGIIMYINHGIPPGDFLTAVICNDLKEACGRADYINQQAIFKIVQWFYSHAPSPCWGSKQAMKQWIEKKGLYGGPEVPHKEQENA
jgi:hypothetical protein